MRRRRFFALGWGAALLAGCGTEYAATGTVGPRARFAIGAGGERWARVAATLVRCAREAGYAVTSQAPVTKVTVTGLPALAAADMNNGLSLLDTATPLARLTGDVEVVVVPATSRFRNFDEFGAHLVAQPDQTQLAGGRQGGPDHLLFGLIAKGLGADARKVDYTGYRNSAAAATALLGGKATAAAGTLADWRPSIDGHQVRVLAVSSAERAVGLDAPTLLESGVRVDFADWCAAVGPDSMSDDSRAAAIQMCDDVCGSRAWQAACRAGGWNPIPLSGDDFEKWLTSEIDRTRAVLRDLGLLDTPGTTCWGSCGNGH
ncbi:tripartite tricarboxylate transporter substrate-binding protein [Nonomuraea sp. NPDC000554]|uniref:tripartite tricarboxylate transporter substrate-binding protein n=1 Tax=Nonomuraea sp. NPDC000554 TaxID=3154259 RepID=UPI00332D0A86